MGFLPDSTKVTQDGADEDEIIAIPNQLGYRLPEGNWQILHWVNPYGAIAGDPTANNVTLHADHADLGAGDGTRRVAAHRRGPRVRRR